MFAHGNHWRFQLPMMRAVVKGVSALGVGGVGITGAYAWSAPPLSALHSEQHELPRAYDAEALAAFWEGKGRYRCVLARGAEVASAVLPFVATVGRDWYSGRLGGMRAVALDQQHRSGDGEGDDGIGGIGGSAAGAPGRDREGEAAAQRGAAAELRAVLTALGPAFVKLGQVLSTRPDLLPQPALEELRELCDAVPPFPTADAIAVLEGELGEGAVTRLFEGLDTSTVPVASASLGQVYKVRLKHGGDGDSGTIALKVQRPDALLSVALDLYLLRRYAIFVEGAKEALGGAAERISAARHWWRGFGAVAAESGAAANPRHASSADSKVFRFRQQKFDRMLIEAFAAASYRELDYEAEASNQERFEADLPALLGKHAGLTEVYVPPVHRIATSRHVLATTWVDGERLDHAPPDVIARLTPVGVRCFLAQLLDMGFFHSDPHPGNMLVTPEGRLALIDFGLCARVSAPDSDALTAAIVHLMSGDVPALLDDCCALGFLPREGLPAEDMAALLPLMQRVYDDGQMQAAAELGVDTRGGAAKLSTAQLVKAQMLGDGSKYKPAERRRKLYAVSRDLNTIFFEFPFTVPEYFALVTRALIVLEGIAVSADPSFDIFAAAYPYSLQRAARLFGAANLSRLLQAGMEN